MWFIFGVVIGLALGAYLKRNTPFGRFTEIREATYFS